MKLFNLFFAAAILLYPPFCQAQSSASRTSSDSAAVSVQELALPRKAADAFRKGSALLARGDPQASLPYFRKVIVLAPRYYGTYHNLGLALSRIGQLDEATLNFQKSIELSSGSFAPSLFGLSMIFYQRAQLQEAETLVQRGLLASPNSAIGRYCLGLVQFSLGRTTDAQRSAQDALRLDPAQIDAHLLLAHVHERLHDPNAVLAEVQTYLKLAPHGELQSDAFALRERAQQDLAHTAASLN